MIDLIFIMLILCFLMLIQINVTIKEANLTPEEREKIAEQEKAELISEDLDARKTEVYERQLLSKKLCNELTEI